jgi:hypothetical protein
LAGWRNIFLTAWSTGRRDRAPTSVASSSSSTNFLGTSLFLPNASPRLILELTYGQAAVFRCKAPHIARACAGFVVDKFKRDVNIQTLTVGVNYFLN